MTGIYKITINDYYIYIGQSVNIEGRWSDHLSELKRNKKSYNTKFQNVFNKYPNTIKFEIIEECDVDKLDEREMYWIDCYKSYNTNHGLNMSIGGECGSRKYRTVEEAEAAALEKRKEYYKVHKKELKEYFKQYAKKYYQNNNNVFREKRRNWYENNKGRLKQYNRQYHENNREKILIKQKEYSRQKGILSHSERFKLQFEKRYNCSRPLTNGEWDTWRTDKSISGSHNKCYAIKFLKSLPNITFTIPSKNK